MPLRLSIFLPKESIDFMESLEEFVTGIGDFVARDYGNEVPTDEFNLEDLLSFIIISQEDLPQIENLKEQDVFLVIPIRGDK